MGLHIPLAAPGRPGDYQPPPGGRWAPSAALPFPGGHPAPQGGCRPPPWGRCTIGCSSLPWWPPSSPGLLRAGRAAAGLLHGEDVPSAALPSPGGLPAPQGCSGPAGRLSATSRGKMAPSVALSSPGGHQLLRAALLFLPGHSGLPPVNRWRQLFWSLPESCSPVGR